MPNIGPTELLLVALFAILVVAVVRVPRSTNPTRGLRLLRRWGIAQPTVSAGLILASWIAGVATEPLGEAMLWNSYGIDGVPVPPSWLVAVESVAGEFVLGAMLLTFLAWAGLINPLRRQRLIEAAAP